MTENEEILFKIIADNDFIFTENLKVLFPHKSYRYLLMKRLEDRDLIHCFKVNSRRSLWYFSELGKAYAKKLFSYYFSNFDIENLPDYNINHSSKLIDIQILILQHHHKHNNISAFYSEKLITKYFKKYEKEIKHEALGSKIRVPDTQFNFNEIKTVALELELTLKSKARYRHIYSFYRNYKKYENIFWIYEDEKIATKIQHYFLSFLQDDQKDLNVTMTNKHVFIPLTNVLSQNTGSNDFFSALR